MRKAILGALFAVLLGACRPTAPASSSASTPSTVAAFPGVSPFVVRTDLSPVSPGPDATRLAVAEARWAAHGPSSYALTINTFMEGGIGPNWWYRIASLDGRTQMQSMDGRPPSSDDPDFSVAGLFDLVRTDLSGPGHLDVTFDQEFGFPTEIDYAVPMVADSDSKVTVTGFISASADGGDAARVRAALKMARAAWPRWEPTAYSYVWRRFDASTGPASGGAWDIERVDGQTTTQADAVSDGVMSADASGVSSTFDAVAAALDTGAWVDLTVDPVSGLPWLAAIDPSVAVTGDEYWIRISFRDIQRETAWSDLREAQDRWFTANLQHYSYTWRYRGRYAPMTYGMTMTGDVAAITHPPGTPVGEASSATPRIADTFSMLEQVLTEGGQISATYDPVLGYPVRVVIDPAGGSGFPGTVTISDFKIR